MEFWVNFFVNEAPLFEDAPQGEASVVVRLDERAAKTISALVELESLEVCHALAALYTAGVHAGERAVRGRPCPREPT